MAGPAIQIAVGDRAAITGPHHLDRSVKGHPGGKGSRGCRLRLSTLAKSLTPSRLAIAEKVKAP